MTFTKEPPHSAHDLNDTRDLWWNRDFLSLLAQRAGLAGVRRALDVGAGQGHWTRTIAGLLSPEARVTGVDREKAWVRRAIEATAGDTLFDVVQGDAQALPWPDATFELVTGQTLLTHVHEPANVVREMSRVLPPGGVILCAEPNNIGQCVSPLVGDPHFDIEDVVALFRLQATCERGKHALGLGYNSIGEHLVRFLPSAFELLGVWNNDRCAVVRHRVDHQHRAEVVDGFRVNADGFGWPRAEALRSYVAGGGDPNTFDTEVRRAHHLLHVYCGKTASGAGRNEGGLFSVLGARTP
jgi:SAM-dependent methyltransferase